MPMVQKGGIVIMEFIFICGSLLPFIFPIFLFSFTLSSKAELGEACVYCTPTTRYGCKILRFILLHVFGVNKRERFIDSKVI